MPRSLDVARLAAFTAEESAPVSHAVPAGAPESRWPSREPVREGQISIKAEMDVIERFRKLCKDDRRTYADMLGILMDRFEAG